MLTNLLAPLSRFRRDRRANFAVMTGLCAFPLIGMTGLAIDYGVALSNKTKLDAAADAAAIAAVTTARNVLKKGGLLTDALSQGQQQGQAAFAANAGGAKFLVQKGVTPNVQFQPTAGQSLTVNVTYTMNAYSQIGKLFNVGQYTVAGSSSSNTVLMPYYQFIFVVDVSNSMAVGGTANDITGLLNDKNITAASGEQCAFACHTPSGNDPRTIAKNDGWKLKIDYVNSAVQSFITSLDQQTTNNPLLQSNTKTLGNFSVGIDTFGTGFATLQTIVSPPSRASNAAKSIDVEQSQPNNNNGYTYTATGLTSALQGITNIGDGSSATAQATYVIFVSDGVEDQMLWGGHWGRQTDVSYTSACNAIKKKGITLISIEASYPSIPNDSQYATLVAPLQPPNSPNMQNAMQSCASDPSWSFKADDGPAIDTAVKSVLARVMQGLTRLTY